MLFEPDEGALPIRSVKMGLNKFKLFSLLGLKCSDERHTHRARTATPTRRCNCAALRMGAV